MDNFHRDPTPFFRAVVHPEPRTETEWLYPHTTHDPAASAALSAQLGRAEASFEVINGRLVQVRNPVTLAPLAGTPGGCA